MTPEPSTLQMQAPQAQAQQPKPAAKTMLGVAAVDLSSIPVAQRNPPVAGSQMPQQPQMQQPPQMAPQMQPPHMQQPQMAPQMQQPQMQQPQMQAAPLGQPYHPPGSPPAQVPQQPPPGNMKTMLGVAIPGIAPLNPGQPSQGPVPPPGAPSPHSALAATQAAPQSAQYPSGHKTMMGVAMPGIAPTRASVPQPQMPAPVQASRVPPPSSKVNNTLLGAAVPQILPMPAPPPEEAMPPMQPPVQRKKQGVPLAVAVGIAVALLVVGGGVIFALYKPASPVVATPELDAEGRDVLRVHCDACADGTKVSLGKVDTTLTAHEGRIVLETPLKVGDNPLVLHVDRPGVGRDEDAKIQVPVAYRLRADLSTLSATPPAITVRVEATPGTDVRVNDKPLTLDATGAGAAAIDVGESTLGPSDETKRIDKTIDYTITPKGQALQKGTLRAQAGIAALRIDNPSSHAVLDKASVIVAGQTAPLADVKVNDVAVKADDKGVFSAELPSLAQGENKVHVVTSPKNLAPRVVDFAITRVASLDDAAKAFEAESPLGFDAFTDGTPARAGAKVVVEGEVVDARPGDHQSLLLVESKRGCSHLGQCLVRVIAAGDTTPARGDNARIYGRYLRNVTAGGKTVPEVASDFFFTKKGPGQ
jgi:hypothetical protein